MRWTKGVRKLRLKPHRQVGILSGSMRAAVMSPLETPRCAGIMTAQLSRCRITR